MSKPILETGFGERIYDKFPKVYRMQDEEVRFTLKRYLEALGEGGYDYIIEKTNELLTFYDYAKVDIKILPYIFESFGLPIFNGLPEAYLRNLLTNIGDLFERKGTKEVVEYLTTIVSGVRSTVEIITPETIEDFTIDDDRNTGVLITLEIDYDEADIDLPSEDQIKRIIREFIPFYCFVVVIYSFLMSDITSIIASTAWNTDRIEYSTVGEVENLVFSESVGNVNISEGNNDVINLAQDGSSEASSVFNIGAPFGVAIFGVSEVILDYWYPDKITYLI